VRVYCSVETINSLVSSSFLFLGAMVAGWWAVCWAVFWWWAARGWRSAGGKKAANQICLGGWGGRSLCDRPPSSGAHALFSGGSGPAFGLFHIGKCPNSFSVCQPIWLLHWLHPPFLLCRTQALAAADHFWLPPRIIFQQSHPASSLYHAPPASSSTCRNGHFHHVQCSSYVSNSYANYRIDSTHQIHYNSSNFPPVLTSG
jgi:hypothetical protein